MWYILTSLAAYLQSSSCFCTLCSLCTPCMLSPQLLSRDQQDSRHLKLPLLSHSCAPRNVCVTWHARVHCVIVQASWCTMGPGRRSCPSLKPRACTALSARQTQTFYKKSPPAKTSRYFLMQHGRSRQSRYVTSTQSALQVLL